MVMSAAITAGSIVLPGMLSAQTPPATAPGAMAEARPQPGMQAMGRAFRTINTGVKDATMNAATLAALAEFQKGALEAKTGVPPMLAALPAEEKAAKTKEYKMDMVKLIRASLDAEDALLAGDNEKAATAVAAMAAAQTEGHAEFRPRRGGGARRGN
jgi:soluble cytochrome b562